MKCSFCNNFYLKVYDNEKFDLGPIYACEGCLKFFILVKDEENFNDTVLVPSDEITAMFEASAAVSGHDLKSLIQHMSLAAIPSTDLV